MRLGDNNFFNLFRQLAAESNRNRDCDEWTIAGVLWRRQRHIHWSAVSSQMEIHRLQHAAKPTWTLIVVHELWWATDRRNSIRNAHWAHLESGDRRAALNWFEKCKRELDSTMGGGLVTMEKMRILRYGRG